MPKINDFLKGIQNGQPGMKDFRHASRLYIDDNYRLMPKQKFMFHVMIQTDESMMVSPHNPQEDAQLDMLVKSCDLPRYGMNLEELVQYNKKSYVATRIQYEPVNITFHDDHADTVNAFWKKYYEYHIADSVNAGTTGLTISDTKDNAYDDINDKRKYSKFGLDTPKKKKKPYLKSIIIFLLHKQRFTSMQLVNPVIGSFAHDTVDNADGAGTLSNVMQVYYETVLYDSGTVNRTDMPGFATLNYDHEPSPLTVLGGGTNSIFGPGGVIDGVGSVFKNVREGNFLGAILGASNTYNNAKKIKKKDAKEELKGIAKKGVLEVGKQAGTLSSPVAEFGVGQLAAVATLAIAKGLADNKNTADTTVITTPVFDSVNFLTANEAYNLVTTNDEVKDIIAGHIYYKDIGSRTGQSVAVSDVAYTNSTDATKKVYRAKAVTDIRKLVTDGFIKIDRETQDITVNIEKANL
tara:strand:+ start:662 stop:2053 length:1392 start_codon:yes stop_codon:yes gene_type:complete